METIIIHPKTADKLKEIKGVLKALKIDFEVKSHKKEADETTYLQSSPVNKKRLNESIRNIKKENVTKVKLQDLWK